MSEHRFLVLMITKMPQIQHQAGSVQVQLRCSLAAVSQTQVPVRW